MINPSINLNNRVSTVLATELKRHISYFFHQQAMPLIGITNNKLDHSKYNIFLNFNGIFHIYFLKTDAQEYDKIKLRFLKQHINVFSKSRFTECKYIKKT